MCRFSCFKEGRLQSSLDSPYIRSCKGRYSPNLSPRESFDKLSPCSFIMYIHFQFNLSSKQLSILSLHDLFIFFDRKIYNLQAFGIKVRTNINFKIDNLPEKKRIQPLFNNLDGELSKWRRHLILQ